MRRYVRYVMAVIVLIGCLRTTCLSPVKVLTGSMVPTLTVGDHVLVNRLAYGLNIPWLAFTPGVSLPEITAREVLDWSAPKRGDVVLFENPFEPGLDYVKRVVGEPGDTVELVEGRLYINGIERIRGREVPLNWKDEGCQAVSGFMQSEGIDASRYWVADITGRAANETFGPIVVPGQSLFVLGDNRDESADSRVWGVVPRHAVRGLILATWMSTDECLGTIDFTWQSIDTPALMFSNLIGL